MAKVAIRSAQSPQPRRKIALWALVASAALLVVAWMDGGEEPIHAIEQVVSLTGEGQS